MKKLKGLLFVGAILLLFGANRKGLPKDFLDKVKEYTSALSFEEIVSAPKEETPVAESELPYGYEFYSELDSLGRCGYTLALVGPETMPTEERGAIGHIRPSGWHTVKYPEVIPDNYLYNRCHLIAFCLAGENDNERNLVTGTRQMNLAMLPYETEVADYVDKTGHHVYYKATPIFTGNNLVCDGVKIEAHSIEDKKINIDVFIENIQDGVVINYATGESHLAD